MIERFVLVTAWFFVVVIALLAFALGAVSKQLKNIGWQIQRCFQTLDYHLTCIVDDMPNMDERK